MRKITSNVKEIGDGDYYVLEPKDVKVLKAVLDYAHHRTVKHGKTIASYREIQRMRRELGLIDDEKMEFQLSCAAKINT